MERIIHRPGQSDLHESDSGRTAAHARKDDQKSSSEHWADSGGDGFTPRERGRKLMGTLPIAEKPQLVPKPLKTKPKQESPETWRDEEAA